ncbi:hypothetical protein RGQ15_10285 [Paracoccus sp. MBLB3053]|uniref:Uncharacterized protein n=1 Tax=Paracoccus aurantius TaxID=3073814 RepID=A0ABU2HSG8_9RHOB|nr:hypothetical protein [Paracoccus sp. MBLB3053]MDS9467953.1 hypothetical protein [Paracoccus sp. MBLB3053]
MTVETRAARLVAALENSGVKVASVTIKDGEIKVTLRDGDEREVDPFDLVDWRREPSRKKNSN